MPKTSIIHGFKITYEDNAQPGADYFQYDLDTNEARVFFDQARLKNSAQFEDDEERQFTLFYQKGNYILVRR